MSSSTVLLTGTAHLGLAHERVGILIVLCSHLGVWWKAAFTNDARLRYVLGAADEWAIDDNAVALGSALQIRQVLFGKQAALRTLDLVLALEVGTDCLEVFQFLQNILVKG